MDRIEWMGDYSAIDMTEAEVNLQRLAESNDGNPNLLLNMLEMMLQQNQDLNQLYGIPDQNSANSFPFQGLLQSTIKRNPATTTTRQSPSPVSTDVLHKVFQKIVQSRHVKLLERAESIVLYNYFPDDSNLLRLLIVGYVRAGAPERAAQLLMEWPDRAGANNGTNVAATAITAAPSRPLPGLKSYRLVITELSKRKDYALANQLLSRLCDLYAAHVSSLSSSSSSIVVPTPDRDFFHRILSACNTPESLETAEGIMKAMLHHADAYDLNTKPNTTTLRLLLRVWAMAATTTTQTYGDCNYDRAMDMLRGLEQHAHSATPDISCWNILINAMAERGDYEKASSTLHHLLTEHVKGVSSVQPDHVTINTVLKAHFVCGTVEAAEAATLLLKRMAEFYSLIHEKQSHIRQAGKAIADRTTPDVAARDETDEMTEEEVMEATRLPKSENDEVTTEPVVPDNGQYTSWLTARAFSTVQALWTKLGRPERAIEVLEEAEEMYRHGTKTMEWRRGTDLKPDEVSYQSIIGSLSKMETPTVRAAQQAERLAIENMARLRYKPNLVTCNAVLNCWTRAGRPVEAEAFLKRMMTELFVQPDKVSFNTVIHGYAQHGNSQRALDLLQLMLRDNLQDLGFYGDDNADTADGGFGGYKNAFFGIEPSLASSLRLARPNTRTFTSILFALSREGTQDAAEQAEDLLLQMKELSDEPYEWDTRPSVVTYNAVLNCWCSVLKTGRKEDNLVIRRAQDFLQKMQNLGPDEQPNVVSYNTMIKGHGNNIKEAEKCVIEMLKRGVKPNQNTYQSLLKVLRRDRHFFSTAEKQAMAAKLRERYNFGTNELPVHQSLSRSKGGAPNGRRSKKGKVSRKLELAS